MVQEIEAEIAALERNIDELRAVAKYHKDRMDKAAPKAVFARPITRETRALHRDMKQIDAAEIVLKEAGKPLKTGEIVERLEARGYPIPDAKKTRVSLYTSLLRRSDRFRRVAVGTWEYVGLNGRD